MDTDELYRKLSSAYCECHKDVAKAKAQKLATAEWNEAKKTYKNSKTPEFTNFIQERIRHYQINTTVKKTYNRPIASYFSPVSVFTIKCSSHVIDSRKLELEMCELFVREQIQNRTGLVFGSDRTRSILGPLAITSFGHDAHFTLAAGDGLSNYCYLSH